MESSKEAPAFDTQRESDNLSAPEARRHTRQAQRQMLVVTLCTMAIAVIALVAITVFQKSSPAQSTDRRLLEYNGMTFERVDNAELFTALGLNMSLSPANCGETLATLDAPATLKGSTACRLEGVDSDALIAVRRNVAVSLYQFCYFTEADSHTGQDILDVSGSRTKLVAIACAGEGKGQATNWENTIEDEVTLRRFETLFGALRPRENTNAVRQLIEEPGSWDAVATLRYENGLTFHLTIYNELKTMTGFRSVYDIPGELIEMLGKSA